MQLEILSPEHKVFTGNVYGVQLPGIQGSFEILENHAPMVAALGKGKMKVIKDKNTFESYEISGGFVEVLNNKTSILIEGATALD
ncbi:MAG: ATP synthase F1 subunit epsilon [Bacteroidetes bacterium]|nr:ATP synthase F1 subunit epsilon [Bacteroidota bacterium]